MKKMNNIVSKSLKDLNISYKGLFKNYEELSDSLKKIIKEEELINNNLIISSTLLSSGSSFLEKSEYFIEDNELKINHFIKMPIIGTCDMKILNVFTFVPKNIEIEKYNISFIN